MENTRYQTVVSPSGKTAVRDMRVTIQVAPEIARSLSGTGSVGKNCTELADLLDNLSIHLVPLHPGADDDALASYFAIDVPDYQTAASVVKRLRPCRGIRAAYIKPADALP